MSSPDAGPVDASWRPAIVDVAGRFIDATNATFLATTDDDVSVVYKPNAGQRPLWDFDSESLPAREVLTYEVSRRMGLGVVPETVMTEGPYGPGSAQRYVDASADFDALPLVQNADPLLWPIAALDVITNNADRKLGHILSTPDGLIAIDHGLTFHAEPKLRTVLWCFAGRPWPEDIVARAAALRSGLRKRSEPFRSVLDDTEWQALLDRVDDLVNQPHPLPPEDRPPVPWPAY
jgi:hypothetical protein